MKFKVTNWAEYDAGLRQHGSLTLWITHGHRSGLPAFSNRRRARLLEIRLMSCLIHIGSRSAAKASRKVKQRN